MTIWRKDIEEDEYKLKKLTDSDIEKAEIFFNIKLPAEYITILREQNGGYIKYNAHPSPFLTSWSKNSINIDHIKGIGKEEGILNTPYFIEEWDLPKGIIIFSGDGHSFISLDYRDTDNEPQVIYLDTQSSQVVTISKSFKDFLSNLYVEEITVDETDLNILSTSDLENAINNNDIENIIIALDTLPYLIDDATVGRFVDKLTLLSTHQNQDVRRSVSEATNSLTDFFTIDNNVLTQLSERFLNDQDPDIQYFGTIIKEKIQ